MRSSTTHDPLRLSGSDLRAIQPEDKFIPLPRTVVEEASLRGTALSRCRGVPLERLPGITAGHQLQMGLMVTCPLLVIPLGATVTPVSPGAADDPAPPPPESPVSLN